MSSRKFLALLGGTLACSPALADFGPQVAHAVWLTLAFVVTLILLPLLASPGQRKPWFLCALIGYPLSAVLLNNVSQWVSTAHNGNDATLVWLVTLTWTWVGCVAFWLRITRTTRAETMAAEGRTSIDPVPTSAPKRAIDFVALATIIALLLDGQTLVTHLTPLSPGAAFGATASYVGASLLAVMGLWRGQQWAWWSAIASTLLGISVSIHFNWHSFAKDIATNDVGSIGRTFIALNNTAVLSVLLRSVVLVALVGWVRDRGRKSSIG